MKNNITTNFTGWSLIVSALMLFGGWALTSHQLEEYLVVSDFEEVNQSFWYWIWMFRIHIFGWVIMGISMIALAVLFRQSTHNVLILPGVGVVVVGSFVLALASAFYYSFGAYGVGQTLDKTPEEIQKFMEGISALNHYVTCLVRFGRVFSGVGLVLLGFGLLLGKHLNKFVSIYAILMGFAAMGIIMLIPDNYEIYKPLFHFKIVWLLATGVTVLLTQKSNNN